MRIAVLQDKSGNIESIAVLSSDLWGGVHVDGGGPVSELEVEDGLVDRDALLGRRGSDAQRAHYEKVRKLLRAR